MTQRSLQHVGRLAAAILLTMAAALLESPAAPQRRLAANPVSETQSSAEGRERFVSACGICHGIDGRGGEHAPDIAASPAVQRLSDTELFGVIQNGIPAGGMPSFGTLGPAGITAIIAYLRILQGQQTATTVAGSAKRGRELFFGVARCSGCHMIHGEGGFMGPDLTTYSVSHSPRDIREAIVNPNKNLSEDNQTVVVVTRDGRKFAGLARNEDNFSLQLQTLDGSFHLFMKSDLATVRHEAQSLMPSDYGSKLTGRDLDDLVSYLVAVARGSRAAAARKEPTRKELSR